MKLAPKRNQGFTLIEVLLVVVILAILAAIVVIAVNPARQISQTNNTQRRADVNQIWSSVNQYSLDNRGAFPSGIPTGTSTVMGSGAGQINICSSLVPTYAAKLPFDPTASGAHWTSCSDYNTGYNILNSGGRIIVSAPSAELSATIQAP